MEERTTLEVIAPSVEEAIQKGLGDLGLPEDAVEVEVLDSGSRGLFGLGSRQARIRLMVKAYSKPEVSSASTPVSTPKPAPEPATVQQVPIADETPEETGSADEDQDLRVARETVSELLEKMKVRAKVTAHYGTLEDQSDQQPILVEVHGDDLSILIGRRSETLNALQYIASLIVGKELERWVPLVIDVEGYRS